MVNEYQITYEYTNGNTVEMRTEDLKVRVMRPHLKVHTRVDGVRVVSDTGHTYRIFACTALLSGDDAKELHDVQNAAITYDGTYPRIQKIYFDGDSTESNIVVAMTTFEILNIGVSGWSCSIVMEEYVQ